MLKDVAREDQARAEVFTDPGKNPPVDLSKIDTLHELLALALDDFEKVLGDKRYAIDMGMWHEPKPYGKCHVCLAGAVIAKTLGIVPEMVKCPDDTPAGHRLEALDCLRVGALEDAAHVLDINFGEVGDYILSEHWMDELRDLSWATGEEDGRRLLSKLRVMQKELEEAGL